MKKKKKKKKKKREMEMKARANKFSNGFMWLLHSFKSFNIIAKI